MKANKSFLRIYVCAALFTCAAIFSACSDDDLESVSTSSTFHGDEAYFNVNIVYTDGTSTSSRATDGGYSYGTTAEQAINTLDFYFYDASGAYILHKQVTADDDFGSSINSGNLEYKSNTTVVLSDLHGKSYPDYMAVVINRPSESSLRSLSMDGALAATFNDYKDGSGNFTISSTSYYGAGEDCDYFATKVDEKNFVEAESDLTDADAITLYVERLAAKVTVNFSDNLQNTLTSNSNMINIGSYPIYDGSATTTTNKDLYAKFSKWGLNATAKKSYAYKNILGNWYTSTSGLYNENDNTEWWNGDAEYRCYWAMGAAYDADYKPTMDASDKFPYNYAEVDSCGITQDVMALEYITYNDLGNGNDFGDYTYCMENTNATTPLMDRFGSIVTSVLLKAELVDENGTAQDLIRYSGVLYSQTDFLTQIMSIHSPQLYTHSTKTTSGTAEDVYTQITSSDVQIKDAHDGKVILKLNTNGEAKEWYQYDSSSDTYTKLTDNTTTGETVVDQANALLAEEFKENTATYFKGGQMYYWVPIEHLRNSNTTKNTAGDYTDSSYKFPEGDYGVVRNHYYKLTINSVSNLGRAVYDPAEMIIPSVTYDQTYQIGAQMNVLSWKVIEQDVDL